jgi:hypothetical protein
VFPLTLVSVIRPIRPIRPITGRVVIVVTLLTFGAAAYAWRHISAERNLTRQVFGGQQLRSLLNSAQTVTAQRLHPAEGKPHGSDKLADYAWSETFPVAAPYAQEIKRLLQDPSSYDWNTDPNTCVLDYGVLLNFQSPKQTLRVAFCFKCRELGIYAGTNDNSAPVGSAEFDPARKKFAEIAKAIFPSDAEIQAIR